MQEITPSGNILPDPVSSLKILVKYYQACEDSRALWIGSLSLLFYDILLTLDMEVKYFWNTRPSFVNCLFFLNRYWPAANMLLHNIVLSWVSLDPSFCTAWFQYTGYSVAGQHMVMGAILIIRVYAIFNCDKRVLAILLVLYALSVTAEIIIIGISTHEFHDYDSSLPKGCIPVNIPRWCWAYWVPPVTFDTILLFLALWKTVRVFIIRDSALQPPLLVTVLLRDSFLYFGGVIISTLANFLTWYFKPMPYYGTFVGCFIASQSILGCRLLLNIRETAEITSRFERRDAESVPECSGILTTGLMITEA